jgi:signal transduction histidine kinase
VLLNLIINSIDAMPEGGQLKLACYEKEHENDLYSVVEVEDTGIGIPEENLMHIFEPFYSTKKSNENRGLGLSLCKDLIDQYNGFIKVRSKLSTGTTFRIYLPKLT